MFGVTLTVYVVVLGRFLSDVSTQRTYQRACECEKMVDGKCAYTLLLPVSQGGNEGDGVCEKPGGSQNTDESIRNISNRLNTLSETVLNQTVLLNRVQEYFLTLQQVNNSAFSGGQVVAALVALNTTLQTALGEIDRLRMTTENLTHNFSVFQDGMKELTRLQKMINETVESVKVGTAAKEAQDARIANLSETVRVLKQGTCLRRAPLFSGPYRLNNTEITVSSSFYNDTVNYGPRQVAIDFMPSENKPGAWCPGEPPTNVWVQFDIGRPVLVFQIATRGRQDYDQWVTNYTVQYVLANYTVTPTNNNTMNWISFEDILGQDEVFTGNVDRSSVQLNTLWRPIFTRYVRILPRTGNGGGNQCMRAELIGCIDEIL